MMIRYLRHSVIALLCVCSSACSGGNEDTVPRATPTVTTPSQAVRGRSMDVQYRFAVPQTAPPFEEDFTVFVHAYDQSGDRIWTDDHQPPTPTRQWKAGTVVEYTRPMLVRKSVADGPVRLEVGLYSTQSRDRLLLSGESDGKRAYRVASFRVLPDTTASELFIIEGFHGLEAPADAEGLEWHWSRRHGTFGLRNPKRDAVLVLEIDQPVALAAPQRVEVRTGPDVLDAFPAPPRGMIVRKIPISAAQLGDTSIVRFTIGVDRAFVPADVEDLQSSDRRELGVRLLTAYFESAPALTSP